MSYAQGTTVSVSRSKGEIEDLLGRYGADAFGTVTKANEAVIGFEVSGRRVRFVLPIPHREEERFQLRGHGHRTASVRSMEAWDQECRRLWRALALVIKAKLEACASGIVTFEQEFMAHIVLPNGKTVSEQIQPELTAIHESGRQGPLLLEGKR